MGVDTKTLQDKFIIILWISESVIGWLVYKNSHDCCWQMNPETMDFRFWKVWVKKYLDEKPALLKCSSEFFASRALLKSPISENPDIFPKRRIRDLFLKSKKYLPCILLGIRFFLNEASLQQHIAIRFPPKLQDCFGLLDERRG